MDIPSTVILSSQQTAEQLTDVLSNNIANLSTPAYKAEEIDFAQYLSTTGAEPTSYVQVTGTHRDLRQGPLTKTDNSLDIGLQGDGFLTVQTSSGTKYTRNGQMSLDAQRELVTANGEPILSAGGAPIILPPNAGSVTIGQDGTVSAGKTAVGKLAVVNFDKPSDLLPAGNGLYATDQAPQPIATTKVMQGMVEESNVQAIIEMTKLMAASRTNSAATDFLKAQSTLQQTAIQQLGKVV